MITGVPRAGEIGARHFARRGLWNYARFISSAAFLLFSPLTPALSPLRGEGRNAGGSGSAFLELDEAEQCAGRIGGWHGHRVVRRPGDVHPAIGTRLAVGVHLQHVAV